jgi:hypothetical protein
MKKMLFGLAIYLSVSAFAAIPPLSNAERESMASDIVVGDVISVEQKLVDSGSSVGRHEHKNWEVTALVEVESILKSTAIREAGETIKVHYWKVARRPRGWSGGQGQNNHLNPNTKVKLYLRKSSETGVFDLLMPNGWEYADRNPLLSLEDSGEMLDLYDTYLE